MTIFNFALECTISLDHSFIGTLHQEFTMYKKHNSDYNNYIITAVRTLQFPNLNIFRGSVQEKTQTLSQRGFLYLQDKTVKYT